MPDETHLFESVRSIARQLESDLAQAAPRALGTIDGEALYQQIAVAMDSCLEQLRALELWGRANRLPSSELWNRCGDWLTCGWLQNQARTKPRGYAGDYLTLARIYRGELCDDPLGRLFDRYFQA